MVENLAKCGDFSSFFGKIEVFLHQIRFKFHIFDLKLKRPPLQLIKIIIQYIRTGYKLNQDDLFG